MLMQRCGLCYIRAEPKKKKKADPRREIMVRERLKKKLKKLERVPPEFIPIEDFITPTKCLDETRYSSDQSSTKKSLFKF